MSEIVLLKAAGDPVPQWSRSAADVALASSTLPLGVDAFVSKLKPVPDASLAQWVPSVGNVHKQLTEPAIQRALGQLLRIRRRKNAKDLTAQEWGNFIHAVEMIAMSGAAAPTYQDFVEVHHRAMTTHEGHAWGAHTMAGHDGRNFLAWHREYLAKFEARLRLVNPTVTIPYWDWVHDRAIPAPLATPKPSWNISRGNFQVGMLPTQQQIDAVLATGANPASFTAFQSALEGPHGWVHNAVGGTMGTTRSPADPLFWLHHAMVDKLWAEWQAANAGAAHNPPNMDEELEPGPIFTRKVSQVRRTSSLLYVYA